MLSEIASKPIGGKDDSHAPGRKPLPIIDGDENADSSISDEDNLKPKAKVSIPFETCLKIWLSGFF